MIITQKFHSAFDIDLEFIPSLEELLSETIPSFEWIKDFEKTSKKNIFFSYYLFFGQHHNAPIGFAQVLIISSEDQKKNLTFLGKIFSSKEEKKKNIKWMIPGVFQEGIIFEPRYRNQAIEKSLSLFEEYSQREDIHEQCLTFSEGYSHISERHQNQLRITGESKIPDTLVKNQSTYQEYLESLSSPMKEKIMNQWKELHNEKLSIEDYESFKELFAYKKNGAELYKKYKNQKEIKMYQKLDTQYIALFKDNKLKAIVFLIKGHQGHFFYDYISLQEDTDHTIIHQMTIMYFYDNEHSHRLHPLCRSKYDFNFESLGFTYRKQFTAQIQ